jgi:hypothetical protein
MLRTYDGGFLGFGLDSSCARSWDRWAGSPALVARVADQIRALGSPMLGGCDFRIEIRVQDDVETFTSPEDFRRNVAPESLRGFTWLAIGLSDPLLDVQFVLRRANWTTKLDLLWLILERMHITTRWTGRGFDWDRGNRLGGAWRLMPEAAFLWVESRDRWLDPRDVCFQVARSATRGGPTWLARSVRLVAPAVLPVVTFESLAYLFKGKWTWLGNLADSEHAGWTRLRDWHYAVNIKEQLKNGFARESLTFGLVYVTLATVAVLAVRLLLPQSEIADPGQTRARQLLRVAGAVATALLITALTKVAFGS